MPAPRRRSRHHTSALSALPRRVTTYCSRRTAGGSPPRGKRLLACRVNAHGPREPGQLEDTPHVVLERAEPDIASRGARLLHGGDHGAHAGAVDIADAAQVHENPGLPAVDETRERAPDLVDGGHVEIPARRDHRHSACLRYVDVHARPLLTAGSHGWARLAAGPRPWRYLTIVQRVPRSLATSIERLSAMFLTR